MDSKYRNFAAKLPQLRLRWLFEITAGCAVVCAAWTYGSLFLDWLAFSLLTVWVARVPDLELRWSLMSCFGGWAALFLGGMCLEIALTNLDGPERRPLFEYLAFTGPVISTCGVAFAICGFVLTCRKLVGWRIGEHPHDGRC